MPRRHPDAPVVAVGVLLLDRASDGRDRVLLVQRGRPPQAGRWTVPGGKVELGETLEEAALRELAEETGLACTLGPIVEILERVVRDAERRIEYHYVILDFVGTQPRGSLRAASDALQARWVTLDELPSLPLTDALEPVIHRAVEAVARAERGPHRLVDRDR